MADAIAPTNISLNLASKQFWTCGHSNTVNGEHLEYVWGSSSGEGQARRPLEVRQSPPSFQGLSPNANPSRTSQTDQARAQCIWPSIVNSYAQGNAPAIEYLRPGWRACSPWNAAAYADGLEMRAWQPCPFAGSSAGTKLL